MDINQALKNTENDLRDLITYLLNKQFGDNWIQSSGVTEDRITKWADKQKEEAKKLGTADPRIFYYADFYDLKTIVDKNWEKFFKPVFDDKKEFEILFSILEEYRNPDAHRRELLPYQKHLALGISGKIRTQITSYFSQMETGESYYPRIEYLQDNLGNSYRIGDKKTFMTNSKLKPGDVIEFTISAFDPLGGKIYYTAYINLIPFKYEWKEDNNFSFEITTKDVGSIHGIELLIKSEREYHAMKCSIGVCDDSVLIGYEVLPPR